MSFRHQNCQTACLHGSMSYRKMKWRPSENDLLPKRRAAGGAFGLGGEVKIYGDYNMGNPRRVAIFLVEKGVEVPFAAIDFEQGLRSDFFRQKNPFCRIPVMEFDDGRCLSESIAICRYFEGLYPDPPLFGVDLMEQVEI